MKTTVLLAAAAALPIATAASASDRAVLAPSAETGGNAETLAIEITADEGLVWSGTLTVGPRYGNASFSQSKNESAPPCEGAPVDPNRNTTMSSSFNFNLSRTNWQQSPDSFSVNFNRNVAIPVCEGQGSDSSGFNRMVEIRPGSSATLRGKSGVIVTISRP